MRRAQDGSRATGTAANAQPEESANAGNSTQGAVHGSQSGTSFTQPTIPDDLSDGSARSAPLPNQGIYQDVLVQCNALIEGYRKGEKSKASVYTDIQSKLAKALGNDREHSDATFEPFIATIESHDPELEMAARRAAATGTRQRSSSPVVSDADGQPSDEEPVTKRPKLNESEYAWVAGKKGKSVTLSENLTKTLKLLDVYSIDPKAAKHSLTNQPDCPEFPIQSGRTLSREEQSILTPYSQASSLPPMTTSKSRDLETSRSLLERLSLPRLSRTQETGPLPGTKPSEQLPLPSLIDTRNSPVIVEQDISHSMRRGA